MSAKCPGLLPDIFVYMQFQGLIVLTLTFFVQVV